MNTNQVRAGIIWSNLPQGVNRRSGPGENYTVIDTIAANTNVIVLCYSQGETLTFTTPPFKDHPNGQTNTSSVWDFVVTSDMDPGGFVADVYINTGGDTSTMLGPQNTCGALVQRVGGQSTAPGTAPG